MTDYTSEVIIDMPETSTMRNDAQAQVSINIFLNIELAKSDSFFY